MISKTILARLLAIFICCTSVTGCWFSSAVAAIPTIIAAITDAGAVLNIIQQAVNTWFTRKPDPVAREKANYLIQKAWNAIRTANHAVSGTEKISQEEYEAAIRDFRKAYAELQDFLTKQGVLGGEHKNILSMDGGEGVETLEIAPPEALSLELK